MNDIPFRRTRLGRGVMATVPVVVASAMTVSLNLTGPIESASAATKRPAKPRTELIKAVREALGVTTASTGLRTASATAPSSYIVARGDSVSSIAERFGLSTVSVLALNGLSWKSLIFPGQTLTLTSAAPAAAGVTAPASAGGSYVIQRGDTVSRIASRFGVTTDAMLAANGLSRASIIYPGRTLVIPAGGAPLAIQTVASVTPDPTPSSSTVYTIRTGDTISSIARATGVSVGAILAANGLNGSSIIYAGRTIAIPTASGSASATAPTVTPTTTPTAEMIANARTIIRVGQRLGVPDRGIVIALATAAQESGLRDLPYGDRDSIGIFQQRPSQGWGSRSQLLDVDYATRLFFGGPGNPNAGSTRGLLDIPGWQGMSLTDAAQAVQRSAYPTAYAKWESDAQGWFARYR